MLLFRTGEVVSGRRSVDPVKPAPLVVDRAGFSLVEVAVAVLLLAVVLAISVQGFRVYSDQVGPRRSAEVFSRDLALARGSAIRERQPVVVEFMPDELRYVVRTGTGRQVVERRFDGSGQVTLSGIELDLPDNELTFDPRGVADLTGVDGPLGTARFTSGETVYSVSFNSLGTSTVAPE